MMANPNPKSRKGIPNKRKRHLDGAVLAAAMEAESLIQAQLRKVHKLLVGQITLEPLMDEMGDNELIAKGVTLTLEHLRAVPLYLLRHIQTPNAGEIEAYIETSQRKIDALLGVKCAHCARVEQLRAYMSKIAQRRSIER